ncbi:MAG: 2-phosphosulfolactate phosphatase [Bacteroidetes bacterium]|jgi:2-phosphosulfolactate phosphatase|nr:2-phosphosulfolactate phosphatase [Bacteroidota bacterium]MBT3749652.1 2-phosphosulfolactate phosphatase [Bacteroidota bacterium]MBT4400064.1 2-phosphosulfolactate phosphatase [Bacteroidota bacterium]MBT4410146.1 2-phosphosulfolactate phosphatase [Bacteroidota bacterium]MBT5425106.1 2-phosphosulfolactate phosphatase [Bacteroidota bacterium]
MNTKSGKRINIALTADEIPGKSQADLVVVIDVLRATSVMITALAHNTPYLIPVSGIEDARDLKLKYPQSILAGERQAKKIPGFDRGNSPLEFMEEKEGAQAVILTTTNGTKALNNIHEGCEVLIASFLNVSAIADYLNLYSGSILLACSGTNGNFSLDDFLCAGALLARLDDQSYIANDLCVMAKHLYQANRNDLHSILASCYHYQFLESCGHGADLDFCIREDIYPLLVSATRSENGNLFISQKESTVHPS